MNHLVSLGLTDDWVNETSETGALRRALGAVFAAVRDSADTSDLARADLAAGVIGCEDGAPIDPATTERLAQLCVDSIKRSVMQTRRREAEYGAQIGALVGKVREAVAALGGTHASLDAALSNSAERFERLSRIDDFHEIQGQLCSEVERLKRLALDQRAEWERTARDFDDRISTLRSQLETTRREAGVDPLTSVANRRTYEQTLRDWMDRRVGFILALIDVDDFKAVNDRHGHAAGDRVLVAIAETLSRSVRAGDVVARIGGDEFAILAATLTLPQAERRYAGLIAAVTNACGTVIPDDGPMTVSVGVAELSAGDTADALQTRADAALYEAKAGGKRRIVARAAPLIRDLRRG